MIDEKVLLGCPLHFERALIYPPKVKDIVEEENSFLYLSLLTETQESMDEQFKDATDDKGQPIAMPTPFQFILANAYADEEKNELFRKAFSFFLKEDVTILPEQEVIIIGDLEKEVEKMEDISDLRLITSDNFPLFQNQIRLSMGEKPIKKEEVQDEDPRIRRMKAKARYREKIAAKKRMKEGKTLSFGTKLTAICCMGIGLTPLNIGEITYASANWLFQVFQNKEDYGISVQSLMAGATVNNGSAPKYWIRNLD